MGQSKPETKTETKTTEDIYMHTVIDGGYKSNGKGENKGTIQHELKCVFPAAVLSDDKRKPIVDENGCMTIKVKLETFQIDDEVKHVVQVFAGKRGHSQAVSHGDAVYAFCKTEVDLMSEDEAVAMMEKIEASQAAREASKAKKRAELAALNKKDDEQARMLEMIKAVHGVGVEEEKEEEVAEAAK